MAKTSHQQTNVVINVKSLKDLPRVVDQVHTLVARLKAGSGVHISIDSAVEPTQKEVSADDASLLD